jgi:hypothetical protein
MKVFGYEVDSEKLLKLNEVTLQCDSEELRSLAKFFEKCADEMDACEDWEHEHFANELEPVDQPSVIVYRAMKS